jgi:hypothetical protein
MYRAAIRLAKAESFMKTLEVVYVAEQETLPHIIEDVHDDERRLGTWMQESSRVFKRNGLGRRPMISLPRRGSTLKQGAELGANSPLPTVIMHEARELANRRKNRE